MSHVPFTRRDTVSSIRPRCINDAIQAHIKTINIVFSHVVFDRPGFSLPGGVHLGATLGDTFFRRSQDVS